jgi:hypothetical protein
MKNMSQMFEKLAAGIWNGRGFEIPAPVIPYLWSSMVSTKVLFQRFELGSGTAETRTSLRRMHAERMLRISIWPTGRGSELSVLRGSPACDILPADMMNGSSLAIDVIEVFL